MNPSLGSSWFAGAAEQGIGQSVVVRQGELLLVDEIFTSLRELANSGVALLLVEQYVHRALELADQVVLLENGTVTFSGPPGEVDSDALVRSYLAGT